MPRPLLPSPVVYGHELRPIVDEHSAALDALEPRTNALEEAGIPGFDNLPLMLADTALAYTNVAPGDFVRGGEHFYEVVGQGETDYHLATAGGVKVRALADHSVLNVAAFGADPSADDNAAAIQAAINAASALGGGTVVVPAKTYVTRSTVYLRSNVTLHLAPGAVLDTVFPTVTGAKGVERVAGVAIVGSCPGDDYTTHSSATGDYFTTGPKAFAASSTIKPGATSFTAANSSDVSGLVAGDWLHLGEGLAAWHPAKSEFVRVEGVAGTTVNLSTRVRRGYANTTTSLGAFIRSYALTASPGSGGAGFPSMSAWADAGFREVVPITNAHITGGGKIKVTRASGSWIGVFLRLAIGCSVDVEIVDGAFWNIDSQDIDLRVRGGNTGSRDSFIANGCNNVRCDIDIISAVAVEEGAQDVAGSIRARGYSKIKQFSRGIDLEFAGIADGTPALEVSTSAEVVIRNPHLRSRSNGLNVSTPLLKTVAPDLSIAFLTNSEVPRYYFNGPTLDGGSCISSDNAGLSVGSSNGVAARLHDTTVPIAQTTRFKGSCLIDGRRRFFKITDAPLFWDLESGETFWSDTHGRVGVTGQRISSVFDQDNWPTTDNVVVINDVTSDNGIQPGDILLFRVTDTENAIDGWDFHVAQVTQLSTGSKKVTYSPANARIATNAAANESTCWSFRLVYGDESPLSNQVRTRNGGWTARNGINAGAPLILGAYHLWVDTSGRLRIKSGAPTSDTDGTVVGTQT